MNRDLLQFQLLPIDMRLTCSTNMFISNHTRKDQPICNVLFFYVLFVSIRTTKEWYEWWWLQLNQTRASKKPGICFRPRRALSSNVQLVGFLLSNDRPEIFRGHSGHIHLHLYVCKWDIRGFPVLIQYSPWWSQFRAGSLASNHDHHHFLLHPSHFQDIAASEVLV